MADLFLSEADDSEVKLKPLADRMRPRLFDQFVGQEDLMSAGKPLRYLLEQGKIHSAIFWGPPGSGKTTLARLISTHLKTKFIAFSAVTSGIKEIKQVMARAEKEQALYHRSTILFIDEIHRFNKAQQDAFLPYVESGKIILLGATTENPSFEVIGALLSRLKVYLLKPLTAGDIDRILTRALADDEDGLGNYQIDLDADAREFIVQTSSGDARKALTLLELACESDPEWEQGRARINIKRVQEIQQRKVLLYDKAGEEHYNLISALHKSLRDSDPDAATYWLARMLAAGEEPLYVARRMIRFAVEDIGLADPNALNVALNARETYHQLGSPEGELALVMAAVYLAAAPKSNRVYQTHNKVMATIENEPAYEVPYHIRNAPTRLMKSFGYGKGYQYAHDQDDAITGQSDLPQELKMRKFYEPSDFGLEKRIRERLEYWEKLRQQAREKQDRQKNKEK
ncbi:MAG: replication-associated recombination protein A [candidate division Zixibacteria bacterium]|nr:replication-associated recombination protein A [candidate division Zixibacteria bacterium]